MKILEKKKINEKNLKDFTNEFLPMAKRTVRFDLLRAFDIYKSNVSYGIIIENDTEKQEVIEWYKNLLDLNDCAFEHIPIKIKKYL